MLSMSKPFYSYLSEKIITYFQTNVPNAGDKYSIQFENSSQVSELYNELQQNLIAQKFVYHDEERNQKYETYELSFGTIQLIIAATVYEVHPDFLATLRNLVGLEKGYESKAILFIHSSSLDSILGGAGSLSKEGMPLHISSVEKDIKRKINEAGFSKVDKQILEMYLENVKKEFEGTIATIFEYEDLIEALDDSQITADEYRRFELFPDDKLTAFTGKKLKDRIDENHINYIKVSEIHSYGLDETKLEKLFGEAGAKRLSKADWQDVNYSEVEKFLASKKNRTTIEYIPIISDFSVWDREEGSTKAKSRIRNILVFVGINDESKEIILTFNDFIRKININVPKAFSDCLICENKGKKIHVRMNELSDMTSFYHFYYKDENAKFDFRIAALRCSPLLLEGIKTHYSVEVKRLDQGAIRINSDEDEVTFNPNAEVERGIELKDLDQVIKISEEERTKVVISEDYPDSEEEDYIHFDVVTDNTVIPIRKAFTAVKPVVIEGLKVWYMKRAQKNSFTLLGDNSLIFGTKRFFTRDEYRKSLDLERRYIEAASPFVLEKDSESAELIPQEIQLPDSVREKFDDIIKFFKTNMQLPSLVYVEGEIASLYQAYIDAVIDAIESISEGTYLKESEKGIFYLGMIKRQYGDFEVLLSPLHPINVAYQLFMNTQDISGIGGENGDLLRKFQHVSLMPYINIDPGTMENKIYVPMEQMYSPEWKIYVDQSLPRYKGSKDFVSKLVAEKIQEFVEHFSYLFSKETNAPIRLNLINTGDAREIVQGIIRYYIRELNSNGDKMVIPIRVTMYSDVKIDNAFETMSRIDDAETLFDALKFDVRTHNMSRSELIDVYRKNVQFYMKDIEDVFDYAHVTFMELGDDNQAINTMMEDIPSGVVMNGISSGVPSELLGDSYRTGFGTKYVNTDSSLMSISVKYNAINAAINGDPYRKGSCYALKMSINKQKVLNRVYEASNWVTFINPKVDLNFFKSETGAKDLLIIHYSDQYNMTSNGYDAITVTQKSKQYQNAISRYLVLNGVEDAQEHSRRIINMFNALNGDWLLRMLSYKSHFPIEKLSILSAMKLAVKRFSIENVIWVPISLEEILRVSGSVGLSQSGSIFSAKNLGFEGSYSDDLLLVGIKNADKVEIVFYPIEIKIGKVESDYLEKGIKQAIRTRRIFDEILEKGPCFGKSMQTRLYRNFFMQQVLVNAGKMLLYEVGDDKQGWDAIVRSDLREKLLGEDYEIVDSFIPDMGLAGVISFREECLSEREFRNREVLIVEKTKAEGVNLLAKEFSEIETIKWDLIADVKNIDIPQDIIDDVNSDIAREVIVENEEQLNNNQPRENSPSIIEVTGTSNTNLSTGRVLIGRDKYLHNVYWEFNNKGIANRHLLITGQSGQGKTYAIQALLYELSKSGVSAVIFDYTEGFTLRQLEKPFVDALGNKLTQRIIYSAGVPINPFKRHEIDLLGEKILEKEADVAARLADIFIHVYGFGSQQYAAIFEAALEGMKKYGDDMNMFRFREELEEIGESNKSAKSVISKMSPFFHTVEFKADNDFDWGSILYDKAKVNIMQLTVFSREMQVVITELMLWDAWYYTKKYGTKDKPFVVVLDEAQNLSHTIKSPSAAILTEGRKFGWSAWFATQSLKVLKDDEVVRLLQAAFKLYFKPTEDELFRITKQLDAVAPGKDWLSIIQQLQKGQCIAVGDKMKPNGMVGPSSPVVTRILPFIERVENQ